MRILWTDEALDDLAEIVTYYYVKASSSTAESVERRTIQHVERLPLSLNESAKATRSPGHMNSS